MVVILDINDLYDESDSDMSDLGDENVAMEKPHEEHVPIEEHMESNETCMSVKTQKAKTSSRANSKRNGWKFLI